MLQVILFLNPILTALKGQYLQIKNRNAATLGDPEQGIPDGQIDSKGRRAAMDEMIVNRPVQAQLVADPGLGAKSANPRSVAIAK